MANESLARSTAWLAGLIGLAALGCADEAVPASASEGETAGETGDTGESEPEPVARIESAFASVCGFHTDGEVTCWGWLGDAIGDDELASAGRLAAPTLPFTQVATLGGTSCGLHAGSVYCWGMDYGTGLLGYGLGEESVSREAALARGGVAIGASVVTVVGSDDGSDVIAPRFCALTELGEVYCWGLGGPSLGYPGLGSIGFEQSPVEVGPVPIGNAAVAVYAGPLGTCALLDDGTLRCWGGSTLSGYDEGFGLDPAEIPPIDLGAPIQSVTVGVGHACALVGPAGEGQVRCWGRGHSGELGHPGQTQVPPGPMLEPVELGGVAVEVVAGDHTTCARLADGTVVCWGSGRDGESGHPHPTTCTGEWGSFDCAADPACCIGDDETPASVGPVALPGPAEDLAGGLHGFCALAGTGSVTCWGSGFLGVIGDGVTPSCFGPVGDEPEYYDCGADPLCCVGDDETPLAAARPVVFD